MGTEKIMAGSPWYVAALVSWGIALFEYSVPGTGEPHRLYRAQPRPAEDSAGSDYAVGVRALCRVVHEPAAEAGLPVCRTLSDGCGIFHFSQCVDSTAFYL